MRPFLITDESCMMTHPLTILLQSLVAKGYERLPPSDVNAYVDGSRRYATYRRDGVRVAFGSNRALGEYRGAVLEYEEDVTCAVLHALITDPEARSQGRASAVMRDVLEGADKAGLELYVEPVPLDKTNGLNHAALVQFYSKFGFETMDVAGRVLKRPASPEPALTLEM